ncbi:MAG: hypothetical protein SGILL_003727 [Bacillariaceae sp.]
MLAFVCNVEAASSHLRKRVEVDNSSEEFGRALLKLYPGDEAKRHSTAIKPQRRAAHHHHIVDLDQKMNKNEYAKEVEDDIEEAVFDERMLQIMSLSMSIPQTPPPTAAPTRAPITPRSPPPTAAPTKAPTVAPTPPPTVYVMPSVGPTEAPTKAPTKAPTNQPTPQPTVYVAPTAAPYEQTQTYPPTPKPTNFVYPTPDSGSGATDPSGNVDEGGIEGMVLSNQGTPGTCSGPSNGVGCASESQEMQGGNPNDIVNCFDVTTLGLTAPFELKAVRFWVGDSSLPPADLSIQVWQRSADGAGPSDTNLYNQDLVGYIPGANTATLTTPLTVTDQEFCVGVKSASMTDGLRIQTDSGTTDGASYIKSPRCGLPDFTSLNEIAGPGDFCIEAMVAPSTR